MPTSQAPGVYRQDVFRRPPEELPTGVPAFLGLGGDRGQRRWLNAWSDFHDRIDGSDDGFLAATVRGFFDNGGGRCYVAPLGGTSLSDLRSALTELAPVVGVDLVCAPDVMWLRLQGLGLNAARAMQLAVLEHCERLGDRLALLDSLPGADIADVVAQRRGLTGSNGALYYPWVRIQAAEAAATALVPACGHIAGVISRCDRQVGVHKPPANEPLHGVLDLERQLDARAQGPLNSQGINCLRAFPGRGIRAWGARTLSSEAAWRYISVRRLFLTAGRWIERSMQDIVFEPNDLRLWARIERELSAYFEGLYRRGALRGAAPSEAFFVKCDAETNPEEVRQRGEVITEIGLAPATPNEFVIVRLIHDTSGTTISGPERPGGQD